MEHPHSPSPPPPSNDKAQLLLEIVREIAHILQDGKSLATLASLCSVSREWNEAFTPILYRHVILWEPPLQISEKLVYLSSTLLRINHWFIPADINAYFEMQSQFVERVKDLEFPVTPSWMRMIENFKWIKIVELDLFDLFALADGFIQIVGALRTKDQNFFPQLGNVILKLVAPPDGQVRLPTYHLCEENNLANLLLENSSAKKICCGQYLPQGDLVNVYRRFSRDLLNQIISGTPTIEDIFIHESIPLVIPIINLTAHLRIAIGKNVELEMILAILQDLLRNWGNCEGPNITIQLSSQLPFSPEQITETLRYLDVFEDLDAKERDMRLQNIKFMSQDQAWTCETCGGPMWDASLKAAAEDTRE